MQITDKIKILFTERSNLHIQLVSDNLTKLTGYLGLSKYELEKRAQSHDQSKFGSLEREGYALLTWTYYLKSKKLKILTTREEKKKIDQAMRYHRKSNLHHPEAHANCNDMSDLDIVEMVCDWTAVNQENNGKQSSCKAWAQENIHKKWKFSKLKQELIYQVIDELDFRNSLERSVNCG